jgi:hypothetical protein
MRVNIMPIAERWASVKGAVPEGPSEISPAIYCWVRVKTGPSRRDDRTDWMWPSRNLASARNNLSSLTGRIAFKNANPALKCCICLAPLRE